MLKHPLVDNQENDQNSEQNDDSDQSQIQDNIQDSSSSSIKSSQSLDNQEINDIIKKSLELSTKFESPNKNQQNNYQQFDEQNQDEIISPDKYLNDAENEIQLKINPSTYYDQSQENDFNQKNNENLNDSQIIQPESSLESRLIITDLLRKHKRNFNQSVGGGNQNNNKNDNYNIGNHQTLNNKQKNQQEDNDISRNSSIDNGDQYNFSGQSIKNSLKINQIHQNKKHNKSLVPKNQKNQKKHVTISIESSFNDRNDSFGPNDLNNNNNNNNNKNNNNNNSNNNSLKSSINKDNEYNFTGQSIKNSLTMNVINIENYNNMSLDSSINTARTIEQSKMSVDSIESLQDRLNAKKKFKKSKKKIQNSQSQQKKLEESQRTISMITSLTESKYRSKSGSKSNFKVFKYIYDEGFFFISAQTVIGIIMVYINNYLKVYCNPFDQVNDEDSCLCPNKYERIIEVLRYTFFIQIGTVLFMEKSVSSYYNYKYRNTLKLLYFYFMMILRVALLSYGFDTFEVENVTIIFQWLYFFLYKYLTDTPWMIVFHKNIYQITYVVLYYFHEFYMLTDRIPMHIYMRILIQNLVFLVMRILIVRLFMIKQKYQIDDYENLRMMINIALILDFTLLISQIEQRNLNELFFLYCNFVVMIVYSITQFHLYVQIGRYFIQKIWQCMCCNKQENLLQCILDTLDLISFNFENTITKYLEKEKYTQETVISKKEFVVYDEIRILRVQASNYLITSLYIFVYYTLIMIFQTYIPFSHIVKKDFKKAGDDIILDQDDLKMIIKKQQFHFTLEKYLITFGLWFFTIVLIFAYGKWKKQKYFSMMKLNKKSKIEQIFIGAYFYYILCENTFKIKHTSGY